MGERGCRRVEHPSNSTKHGGLQLCCLTTHCTQTSEHLLGPTWYSIILHCLTTLQFTRSLQCYMSYWVYVLVYVLVYLTTFLKRIGYIVLIADGELQRKWKTAIVIQFNVLFSVFASRRRNLPNNPSQSPIRDIPNKKQPLKLSISSLGLYNLKWNAIKVPNNVRRTGKAYFKLLTLNFLIGSHPVDTGGCFPEDEAAEAWNWPLISI